MRILLATVPMDGTIIIGEGEKDDAPMLFAHIQALGTLSSPHHRWSKLTRISAIPYR